MNHAWNTCAFRQTLQQYQVSLFFTVVKSQLSSIGRPHDLADLVATLSSIDDPDQCWRFLRDLCTAAELEAMAERWAIARMLWQRVPYKRIVRERRSSSTTIARVARWLYGEAGGYRCALVKRENASVTDGQTVSP